MKGASEDSRFRSLQFPRLEFRGVFVSEKDALGRSPFSEVKPTKESLDKTIHLNKNDERIDAALPNVPDGAEERFRDRTRIKKFCNNFQLLGQCILHDCRYDHNPIDSELLLVLRKQCRKLPCVTGWRCRTFDCFYGHVCPYEECAQRRGGQRGCTFGPLHDIDTKVSQVLREGEDSQNKSGKRPWPLDEHTGMPPAKLVRRGSYTRVTEGMRAGAEVSENGR